MTDRMIPSTKYNNQNREITTQQRTTTTNNQQQQPKKQKQTTLLQYATTRKQINQRKRNEVPNDAIDDNNDDPSTEHWGDNMQAKTEGTYRICFENINGLGFEVHHNLKQDRFITWARENEIDAMGWAEVNLNWKLTTPSEKLRERL